MESGKLNAKEILRVFAEIRKRLPEHVESPRPSEEVRTQSTGMLQVETEEDFEWAAVIDGMESLVRDIESVVEQKKADFLEEYGVKYGGV
jgi:hypothetical protein